MTPRQIQTSLYLGAGTILGAMVGVTDRPDHLNTGTILLPILFGLALTISNRRYLNWGGYLIPLYFLIIFLLGSPFLGQVLFFNNTSETAKTLQNYTFPLGAFLLVILCSKLFIRGLYIGLLQIAMMLFIPIGFVLLLDIIGLLETVKINLVTMAVLHQTGMSVIIISAME